MHADFRKAGPVHSQVIPLLVGIWLYLLWRYEFSVPGAISNTHTRHTSTLHGGYTAHFFFLINSKLIYFTSFHFL